MTAGEMLEVLIARCKCGVHLSVNDHRDVYETAEQRLADLALMECPVEITDDVRARIIETDTMITLQFYPDTPIGFYHIVHYDLTAALTEAIDSLAENDR